MAITWQNINAPDIGQALRPLAAAQQSVDSALSTLGGLFKGAESTANFNAGVVRDNNTEEALNSIYAYLKPEDIKAAIASGGLQEVIQNRFGGNINKATVRNALDTRPAILMERDTASDAYDMRERVATEKPLADALFAEAYKDLPGTKAKVLSSDLVDKRGLMQHIYELETNQAEEQRRQLEADSRIATDTLTRAKVKRELAELDKQAKLRSAENTLYTYIEDFQTNRAKTGKTVAALLGMPEGSVFDPSTATPETAVKYKELLSKPEGKGLTFEDPEAFTQTLADKLKKAIPDVTARRYAMGLLPQMVDARLTSPLGITSRTDRKAIAEAETQVALYQVEGRFPESIKNFNTAAAIEAAKKGVEANVKATATNDLWYQTDAEEELYGDGISSINEGIIPLIEKGIKLKVDGKEVTVPFPIEIVRDATAAGVGGDEQASYGKLTKYKQLVENGVDGDKSQEVKDLVELYKRYRTYRNVEGAKAANNIRAATK